MLKKQNMLILVLAFCVCFVLAMPVFATDKDNIEISEKNIEVNGYSFNITEEMTDDASIMRTYVNNTKDITELSDVDKGKALLIALGMDEESLELWDDETILSYLNSEHITTSVAYYEVNEKDNITTKLSEEDAVERASFVNQQRMSKRLSDDIIEPYAVTNPFDNGYIRVYHSAAYQGSGKYIFGTDSLWLSMPYLRGKDGIGSCAQLTAVVPNTESISWNYDEVYNIQGDLTTIRKSGNSCLSTKNDVYGSFTGVAATFNLPNDYRNEDAGVTCENFRVHFQYIGVVQDESNTNQNFNSIATYSHAKISIGFTPSIAIGKGSFGIGFSLSGSSSPETYPATILVKYLP